VDASCWAPRLSRCRSGIAGWRAADLSHGSMPCDPRPWARLRPCDQPGLGPKRARELPISHDIPWPRADEFAGAPRGYDGIFQSVDCAELDDSFATPVGSPGFETGSAVAQPSASRPQRLSESASWVSAVANGAPGLIKICLASRSRNERTSPTGIHDDPLRGVGGTRRSRA